MHELVELSDFDKVIDCNCEHRKRDVADHHVDKEWTDIE